MLSGVHAEQRPLATLLTTLSHAGTGPPADARPGVFAVGVFDARPPDKGKKKDKKKKEQDKKVATLREQGKVKLIKTQELMANLPELAKAGSYILVRCLLHSVCPLQHVLLQGLMFWLLNHPERPLSKPAHLWPQAWYAAVFVSIVLMLCDAGHWCRTSWMSLGAKTGWSSSPAGESSPLTGLVREL